MTIAVNVNDGVVPAVLVRVLREGSQEVRGIAVPGEEPARGRIVPPSTHEVQTRVASR